MPSALKVSLVANPSHVGSYSVRYCLSVTRSRGANCQVALSNGRTDQVLRRLPCAEVRVRSSEEEQ